MLEAGTKLRLRFAKEGRAVYISHLDLMRTMQRAFLRAEYPLKYSEGFNPHAQISIVMPLSVGTSASSRAFLASASSRVVPRTMKAPGRILRWSGSRPAAGILPFTSA